MKSVNTFRNYLVSQTTSLFSQQLPNKPNNDTYRGHVVWQST